MIKKTNIKLNTNIDYEKYHKSDINIFEVINNKLNELDFVENTDMYAVEIENNYNDEDEETTSIIKNCTKIEHICDTCNKLECSLSMEYRIANAEGQQILL